MVEENRVSKNFLNEYIIHHVVMRAMGKTDTGLENEGFFDVLFKMVHE